MSVLSLKLAGGALLSAAGALLGLGRRAAMFRRLRLLRDLSAALGLMRDELTVLCTPLPQIFRLLGDRPFFRLLDASFGTAETRTLWRAAAETLDLAPQDRAALAGLGDVVGRYDAQRQAASLDLVRRRLARSADALEREAREKASGYPALGLALGAMLAVVLF